MLSIYNYKYLNKFILPSWNGDLSCRISDGVDQPVFLARRVELERVLVQVEAA